MAREGSNGPHRPFEYMALANHFVAGHAHYDVWLEQAHPESLARFYPMVTPQGQQNTAGAGDTSAIQVWPADAARRGIKADLLADLRDHLPAPRQPRLPRRASV
jgi:hypothetical protein